MDDKNYYKMDEKKYYKVLDNGMKVLLILLPNSKIITTELYINCGFFYEKKNYEISHLLEHFQAKLTSTKYPHAKENLNKFSQNGINRYASTSLDTQYYTLSGNIEYQNYMLDIFLNSIVDFKIDETINTVERNAVKLELEERMDDDNIFYSKQKNLYFKNTNQKGLTIKTRINNVDKITIEDLLKFRQKYYSTRNMLFCVTGDINAKETYKYIKNFMKSYLELDYPTPKLKLIKNPIKNNKIISVIHPNIKETTYIRILFFHNIDFIDRDYPIILALERYLKYILFEKLRTELGYIYDINILNTDYDGGLNYFEISTEFSDKKAFLNICKIIFDEINKLKTQLLSQENVDRIKNELIHLILILALDKEPNRFSYYYSKYLLKNTNIIKFKHTYKIFKNLNAKKIINIAKKIFKMKHLLISYMSNTNYNNEIKELFPNIEFV